MRVLSSWAKKGATLLEVAVFKLVVKSAKESERLLDGNKSTMVYYCNSYWTYRTPTVFFLHSAAVRVSSNAMKCMAIRQLSCPSLLGTTEPWTLLA